MLEAINAFLHDHILVALGLFIAVMFHGSKILTRVGVPQVVGFIIMGAPHGPSFLNAVPLELIDQLTFISEIALGLIGFDMGGHLLMRDLRQLGCSIIVILLFEALGTFALVTAGAYALTATWHTALIFRRPLFCHCAGCPCGRAGQVRRTGPADHQPDRCGGAR